jgi:aminoglycoside 3-N-acetyltransferase
MGLDSTRGRAPEGVDAGHSRAELGADLAALGVTRGTTVLVHCSLRQVGRVAGGAQTLREALLDVLDEKLGTLVVPAQTSSNTRTSADFRAATARLDEAGLAAHLAAMPGFDPAASPSEGMGALAESVRCHPKANRSAHPLTSFAAVGALADEICAVHPLNSLLGKESPLGRLQELDAMVLLLGVGFDKCTAFHLGENEFLSGRRRYSCKIDRSWTDFEDLAHRDADFAELGLRFERDQPEVLRCGRVGAAWTLLFPLRAAAEYAARELPKLRFEF